MKWFIVEIYTYCFLVQAGNYQIIKDTIIFLRKFIEYFIKSVLPVSNQIMWILFKKMNRSKTNALVNVQKVWFNLSNV